MRRMKLSRYELEMLLECVKSTLKEVHKQQFSNSFSFQLEELEYKLRDSIQEMEE